MKIICPHCNKEFNEAETITQPRKKKYKWYEFSGQVSLCPACNKQYALDISITGLAFVFIISLVMFFCINSNYNLAAMPLTLLTIIASNKFKQIFVVVKGVESS